jgi:hypothetical protein
MLVISATWEEETVGLWFKTSLDKVRETLFLKKKKKKKVDLLAHTYNPSCADDRARRIIVQIHKTLYEQ